MPQALGMTEQVARRFQQVATGNRVHGAATAGKAAKVQTPRAAGGAGKRLVGTSQLQRAACIE